MHDYYQGERHTRDGFPSAIQVSYPLLPPPLPRVGVSRRVSGENLEGVATPPNPVAMPAPFPSRRLPLPPPPPCLPLPSSCTAPLSQVSSSDFPFPPKSIMLQGGKGENLYYGATNFGVGGKLRRVSRCTSDQAVVLANKKGGGGVWKGFRGGDIIPPHLAPNNLEKSPEPCKFSLEDCISQAVKTLYIDQVAPSARLVKKRIQEGIATDWIAFIDYKAYAKLAEAYHHGGDVANLLGNFCDQQFMKELLHLGTSEDPVLPEPVFRSICFQKVSVILESLRKGSIATSVCFPEHRIPSLYALTPQQICAVAKKCLPQFRIEVNEGKDYILLYRETPANYSGFKVATDGEDCYPGSMWRCLKDYLMALCNNACRGGVSPESYSLQGGRFESARKLQLRNLPFLRDFSLGQIMHIVQLSISCKKLLGYANGILVPFPLSDQVKKERNASLQMPTGPTRVEYIVNWQDLRSCLIELFRKEMHQSMPLSVIKTRFRRRLRVDLSETSLGYTKMMDLFKDPCLSDICRVENSDKGVVLVSLLGPKYDSSCTKYDSWESKNDFLANSAYGCGWNGLRRGFGKEYGRNLMRHASAPIAGGAPLPPTFDACIGGAGMARFPPPSCMVLNPTTRNVPTPAVNAVDKRHFIPYCGGVDDFVENKNLKSLSEHPTSATETDETADEKESLGPSSTFRESSVLVSTSSASESVCEAVAKALSPSLMYSVPQGSISNEGNNNLSGDDDDGDDDVGAPPGLELFRPMSRTSHEDSDPLTESDSRAARMLKHAGSLLWDEDFLQMDPSLSHFLNDGFNVNVKCNKEEGTSCGRFLANANDGSSALQSRPSCTRKTSSELDFEVEPFGFQLDEFTEETPSCNFAHSERSGEFLDLNDSLYDGISVGGQRTNSHLDK